MASGIFVNESGRILVSLFFWIDKRVTTLLPIFFYHKLAQSLLTMGLGRVVTPPGCVKIISEQHGLACLPDDRVIYIHALPNAVNPLITLLGFEFRSLLSGAFIAEYFFNWQGLEKLTLEAVTNLALYLVMASLMMVRRC